MALTFFKKHWRGQYALALSFWVITPLAVLALILSEEFLAEQMLWGRYSDLRSLATMLASFVISGAAVIWLGVGLFRAAKAHWRARPGLWRWLFVPPPMLVALVLLLTLWPSSVVVHGKLQNVEVTALFRDPDRTDYSITLDEGAETVRVAGYLSEWSVRKLEALLDATPTVRTVDVGGVIGSYAVSYDLMKIIRERNLNTVINGRCSYACVVAFSGGRERWLGRYILGDIDRISFSEMGVSRISFSEFGRSRGFLESLFSARERSTSWWPASLLPRYVQRAYGDIGVSRRFLATAQARAFYPDLDIDTLLDEGVVTQLVPKSNFASRAIVDAEAEMFSADIVSPGSDVFGGGTRVHYADVKPYFVSIDVGVSNYLADFHSSEKEASDAFWQSFVQRITCRRESLVADFMKSGLSFISDFMKSRRDDNLKLFLFLGVLQPESINELSKVNIGNLCFLSFLHIGAGGAHCRLPCFWSYLSRWRCWDRSTGC